MQESMLTRQQLADRLHLHIRTIDGLRSRNEGPRHVKIGRRVLYRTIDVERWERTLKS